LLLIGGLLKTLQQKWDQPFFDELHGFDPDLFLSSLQIIILDQFRKDGAHRC
jgi:hypothetical protein